MRKIFGLLGVPMLQKLKSGMQKKEINQ